jgi:hypothetical protein
LATPNLLGKFVSLAVLKGDYPKDEAEHLVIRCGPVELGSIVELLVTDIPAARSQVVSSRLPADVHGGLLG